MKKYQYLEVVKVGLDEFTSEEGIANLYGYIQTDGSIYQGEFIWGVFIDSKKEMYMLKDSQLTSTGRILNEDDIYDGTKIHVKVDPKRGASTFEE